MLWSTKNTNFVRHLVEVGRLITQKFNQIIFN